MPLVSPPLAGSFFFFASATWETQHQYYTTLKNKGNREKGNVSWFKEIHSYPLYSTLSWQS